MTPYRAPERSLEANAEFNNHVSKLRIRSEHTIGFLKGRFPSLKGLRLRIDDAEMHRIATYWISICIAVHTFAFQIEQEERGDDDEGYLDPFIREGESTSSSDSSSDDPGPESVSGHAQDRRTSLNTAKEFRLTLQRRMSRSTRRRAMQRTEG